MKIYAADKSELMQVSKIERQGSDLVLKGKVFGTMPMSATLTPDQARAITIMYVSGLTHSELAEHLSVPLGTAKSWVRRGTASLKECMTS